MSEIYEPWKLDVEVPRRVYIESVHYDHKGLLITLRDASISDDTESAKLHIFFDAPIGYRNFDESERLKLWAMIPTETLREARLFIVNNSLWSKWLCEESCGVKSMDDLCHYAIFTGDDCFEVLSEYPPSAWLSSEGGEMG